MSNTMNRQAELAKYNKLKDIVAPYEALLFDVDGTLADNMHAHKGAYVSTALEYGITLDPDIIDETAGWPTIAVAEEIAKRYKVVIDYEKFAKRKSAIFINDYITTTEPISYVRDILFHFQSTKRIGIVTGGSRSTIDITLQVIDITGRYEAIVCAGDTTLGKPSAQPFLRCANLLRVDPKRCIVLEDGAPGIQGAIAAGMGWVRIDQL